MCPEFSYLCKALLTLDFASQLSFFLYLGTKHLPKVSSRHPAILPIKYFSYPCLKTKSSMHMKRLKNIPLGSG